MKLCFLTHYNRGLFFEKFSSKNLVLIFPLGPLIFQDIIFMRNQGGWVGIYLSSTLSALNLLAFLLALVRVVCSLFFLIFFLF
jgi:hypothetical protein